MNNGWVKHNLESNLNFNFKDSKMLVYMHNEIHWKIVVWNTNSTILSKCVFYHLEYLDYCLHFHCYTRNILADMICLLAFFLNWSFYLVQGSVEAPKFDMIHMKKTKGHISWNVVNITIKTKVWIFKIIKKLLDFISEM